MPSDPTESRITPIRSSGSERLPATSTATDDNSSDVTYLTRTESTRDLGRWIIVGAVVAAFVVLMFIVVPKVILPSDEAAATSSAVAAPASVSSSNPGYIDAVMANSPTHFWQFTYGATPTADEMGTSNLTFGKGVTMLGTSAIAGYEGAIDCSGTNTSLIYSQTPETLSGDYTLEVWVNTTAPAGGQIINFGSSAEGVSKQVDRTLYLNQIGFVNIGTTTEDDRFFAQSEKAVNDGQWHHIVGTMSTTAGLTLYIDGAPVATEPEGNSASQFEGFWRICGDSVSGWPAIGGKSAKFVGQVDAVAVYPTVLTADDVAAHYAAAQ